MVFEETQFPLRYASDLIEEKWEILQPIIDELEPYTTGRPRMSDLREILNAIFYLNKTGRPGGICRKTFFPASLLTISNTGKSRNPDPTAAIIDSQSIKGTPEFYLESGFDGGKLIKGKVDTMGCLIIVRMCAAHIFAGKAARQLITDMFSLPSYRHKNLGR